MKQKTINKSTNSDSLVNNIRRKSSKIYSAEEKTRIVLDGLSGEMNIAGRQEDIAESVYHKVERLFGSWQATACRRYCPCGLMLMK